MKKIIAFYLPQYHTIPENDRWWGEGFTEWTNVKNAKPLFHGHKQPKKPLNDNYYDLLDDNVKKWQVSLAKENGLFGFCFYHYWFNGKLMLEKPIEQFYENKELDINYCLCWANPPWTKIWAGKGSEVLIDQEYGGEEQWAAHFDYLKKFFKDPRYIKEDGCPLLVIYMPNEIPCIEKMVPFLRKKAIEEGFPGIKIMCQYYVSQKEMSKLDPLFDYFIRFQPIYANNSLELRGLKGVLIGLAKRVDRLFTKLFKKTPSDKMLKLRVNDYDAVWNCILSEKVTDNKFVSGAFVAWDNTPRRGKSGRVTINSSPEKFREYMKKLIAKTTNECSNDYIFVTAWNEWSEGSYLEPDEDNGDSYLKAIKDALISTKEL